MFKMHTALWTCQHMCPRRGVWGVEVGVVDVGWGGVGVWENRGGMGGRTHSTVPHAEQRHI